MNILFAIIFGIIEGITEWLPISSTGHLILFEQWMKFQNVSPEFWSMFEVVIQLGAILAVVVLYFKNLFPFKLEKDDDKKKIKLDKPTLNLWGKILVACIPAAIVGVLLDDWLEAKFYNAPTIATMLILVGIVFIIVESVKKKEPRVEEMEEITYKDALIIGLFQLIAAIFPGTSRSGATIIGALIIGISRSIAAEFTFYLAVPVMVGASLLKILKFGAIAGNELAILIVGMLVAFVISLLIIKFIMKYIKKHDFKVFGYYRILIGIVIFILIATHII